MQANKRTVLLFGGAALGASLSLSLLTSAQQPTIGVQGIRVPGGPGRPLVGKELENFLRGRALFDKAFHRSDGLGTPEMNADSCRACHQDPVMGGAGPIELNVSRFASDNGGVGPYQDLPGGQAASKLRPSYVVGREEIPAAADVFEQRQTPSILGAGFVTQIFDASVLANEDPTDLDTDGVFGVARMVDTGGFFEVGKFGWKAQVPTLGDFVRDALGGECGITTPDDGRGFALTTDLDTVADPELSQAQVDDILFFLANLAAPQRGPGGPSVVAGEGFFTSTGCATCHVPTLDGPDGPVPIWSNLLLHNVMPPGFRGMSEPGADVGMYKTPPLWGVKDTAPYMHDGRAEDLRGAIEAHFGEALAAKNAFLALPTIRQDQLIAFLEDL